MCGLVWFFLSWTVLCFMLCLWVDISKTLAWRMLKGTRSVPNQTRFYSVTTENNSSERKFQFCLWCRWMSSPKQLWGAPWASRASIREKVVRIQGRAQTSPGTRWFCPVSAPGENADVSGAVSAVISLDKMKYGLWIPRTYGIIEKENGVNKGNYSNNYPWHTTWSQPSITQI